MESTEKPKGFLCAFPFELPVLNSLVKRMLDPQVACDHFLTFKPCRSYLCDAGIGEKLCASRFLAF